MSNKADEKHMAKWRSWVSPVVVSTCVFVVLTAASALSTLMALVLAAVVVVGGLVLLKSM